MVGNKKSIIKLLFGKDHVMTRLICPWRSQFIKVERRKNHLFINNAIYKRTGCKNKMEYGVFIYIFLIVLSGCSATMPPLVETVSLEKAPKWNAEEYELILKDTFGPHLNDGMQQFVLEVLAQNPDLRSLAKTASASRNRAKIANAEIWPQLDLNLSGTREKNILTKKIDKGLSGSVDLNWRLDIWGKLSDEATSAQLFFEKDLYEFAQAKRVLVAQSVLMWVKYLSDIRTEKNLILLKTIFSHLLDHYEDSYQAGLVPYEFYLDAKNNQQRVITRMAEVQLERLKAKQTMNIMRGRFPTDLLTIKGDKVPIDLIALPNTISAISLAERPDIRAAFAQTQAFDYSARASHKALLPQINLSVSALKNGETLKDLFQGNLIWQLVGGLVQPLFNGGQLRAIARQKSDQAEASWWQYRNTVFKALLEVEHAMAEDKILVRQIKQKQIRMNDLVKKNDSARERFRDRDIELPDYLQAEVEQIETQIELGEFNLLYIKNRLSLVMALGLPLERLLGIINDES